MINTSKHTKPSFKKYFLFFILPLLLILIVLTIIFLKNRNNENDKIEGKAITDNKQFDDRKDAKDAEESLVFSHDMFDTSLIKNITPLGELNGGGEEATALNGVMMNIKIVGKKAIDEVAIYAPTDMKLQSYAYTEYGGEPATWTLRFTINNYLNIRFDHVNKASKAVVKVTTNKPTKNDSTDKMPKEELYLKAGDLIGYTTGTSRGHNWNIYLYDTRNENTFVNMERYKNDKGRSVYLNSVCPFSYYPSQMQKKYIKLMGATAPGQSNDCGNASNDIKGTISGMWHLGKEGTSISYQNIYSTPISIYRSSANEIILAEFDRKRFTITAVNPTFKIPKVINTKHCYKLKDDNDREYSGYAYFKLISENEMEVVYERTGTCPSVFPSSKAIAYYR